MQAINNQLDIDMEQVLQNVGYDADCKLPARMTSLVDDYVENVHYLVEPSYSGIIRDVKLVQGSHVVIDNSIAFESEVIARLLERCQKAAVFLATIGKHLEDTTHQLSEDGHILQATVLDAIGSAAAESVANFVQDKVGEIAQNQGLYMSRRFSPGYCDWDISQQKTVFQAMNSDSAGIRLTEGYLMLPRKSISGIIGLGPRDIEDYNPCKICNKHDCLGRR